MALVVLFHEKLNVAAVPLVYRLPSTYNSTLVTPTLSVAVPDTSAVVPEIVAPGSGEPMETVGGVVSTVTPCAVTVREYVATKPLQLAVSLAVTSALTVPAVAVNAALIEPAGITTVAGTLTEELLLLNLIVCPSCGAAVGRVTVQLLVRHAARQPCRGRSAAGRVFP